MEKRFHLHEGRVLVGLRAPYAYRSEAVRKPTDEERHSHDYLKFRISQPMAVEQEMDKLSSSFQEGMATLTKKIEEANEAFSTHVKEGIETADMAMQVADRLGNSVAKARAMLAQMTNFGPALDE